MGYILQLLDFLCREEVAKTNFEYIYFSTPNTKVIDSLSEEEKEDPTLVPPESSIENCEVCTQTDKKVTDLMNELGTELKSK